MCGAGLLRNPDQANRQEHREKDLIQWQHSINRRARERSRPIARILQRTGWQREEISLRR